MLYIKTLNQFDLHFPLVEKKTYALQSNVFLLKKKKIENHPETIGSVPDPCDFIYVRVKFKFLNIL